MGNCRKIEQLIPLSTYQHLDYPIYMRKIIILPVLLLLILFTSSCYYDTTQLLYPGGVTCTTVPSYASEVSPLVTSRCAMNGCHSANVTNSGGPLVTYTQIKAKAAVIKTTVLNGSMPKGSTFTAAQIKAISCWVDNGAPNN